MRLIVKIIFFFTLFNTGLNAQVAGEYTSSSVLAEGNWFRILITEDGVYRIGYSELRSLGVENPSNPKIFGNNAGQLSYYNNDVKPDDLKEMAIHLVTGSDGIFNEGDYLLFYGKGTNKWIYNTGAAEYQHIRHNYSDTAVYFLTTGQLPGKRTGVAIQPAGIPTYATSASDVLFIHEKEIRNLMRSGREWYQPVSPTINVSIDPQFEDIIPAEEIRYSLRVADRASIATTFRFLEGTTLRQSVTVQGINLYDYTGAYARIAEATGSFVPLSAKPVFEMRYLNNGEGGEHGWLDYVKLHGRRLNIYKGGQMHFFDSRSVQQGGTAEYFLTGSDNSMLLWDITDPFNTKSIDYLRNGQNLTFRASADSLRTFIAFLPGSAKIPKLESARLPNQNLHSSEPADMIIVTHPLFMKYAVKLAGIHERNSGLISLVVTPDQIYNEFSGGIRDIAAIRNFIRMKFLKQAGSDHPLKYLLLFGDGSYENKTPPPNPNYIPTWQSQNSVVVVSSFASDDFYGLLENDEGEATGSEDIGIGRLPVSDTVQAGIVVSKIARYINPSGGGDWKNIITLVADDEDGNSHMVDAEGLSSLLSDSVPTFNLEKIYMDAFRQVTSSGGESYPEVNKAINERINEGCLIFNYIGHGSENGLAHERIVKPDDINSWSNTDRLPLFITATCEFSRFDNMDLNVATRDMSEKTSAGELVLFNKNGGGIALMSTTRVVYSAPNYYLNKNIFDAAFRRDESGKALRLGDIIRIAKNNSGSGPNKRNFSLLGDPAVRLAYPWYGNVATDSVNHKVVGSDIDTLKALSIVTVSGHVEDLNGNLAEDFSGNVYPVVFDKENKIRTLANDGGSVMEFSLRSSILYRGKITAAKGRFSFTFMVPRDINYSYGNGKISYYAGDEKGDMNGSLTGMTVGGFTNKGLSDTTGPLITLYLNDTLFRSGGITDEKPVLLALIEDEGGINTTGAGIGHDLTGYIDNDQGSSFILNNYFENAVNDYMKGQIIYKLPELEEGKHSLTVKAWDNHNNSSEESIRFIVKNGENFILNNLINYPNPFIEDTRITAGHNRPDTFLEVIVNIYNLNGQLIKIIRKSGSSSGYTLPSITWNGNDDGGKKVGRGIYPYSVTVKTEMGEITRASGRMIIL